MRQGASLVIVAVIAACVGTSCSSPSAPTTPPTDTGGVEVSVYNSASGLVRTVFRQINVGQSLSISVGELGTAGVDPLRIAVRQRHAGEQLGSLVAFSAAGTVAVNALPGSQYDVFLMNLSNGVSYECLDYNRERGAGGISSRYATLRRASPMDAVRPDLFVLYAPLDGPDDQFRWAAELFTRALNPFGLKFGSVTFTTSGTADIVAGWADIPGMGLATSGTFAVSEKYRSYPANPAPAHELAHAWLGASDYFQNRGCWEGQALDGLLFSGGVEHGLSPRGEDALRYWALRADSWR